MYRAQASRPSRRCPEEQSIPSPQQLSLTSSSLTLLSPSASERRPPHETTPPHQTPPRYLRICSAAKYPAPVRGFNMSWEPKRRNATRGNLSLPVSAVSTRCIPPPRPPPPSTSTPPLPLHNSLHFFFCCITSCCIL